MRCTGSKRESRAQRLSVYRTHPYPVPSLTDTPTVSSAQTTQIKPPSYPRTPVPPPSNLPSTHPPLDPNPKKSSKTYPCAIRHARRAERKLPLAHPAPSSDSLLGLALENGSKGIDVDGAADEALVEDDEKDEVDGGEKGVECLQG